MYKLILFILAGGFIMTVYALQIDEELAMHALFQGKHAVNRAVHAAAQQVDPDKLASGIYSINPSQARQAALAYLRKNLLLDGNNFPLPGTFLRTEIEVLALDVINETETFPFIYSRSEYVYQTVLQKPGVVMIIRLEYPRTYRILEPIVWEIKGAAELVY